MFCALADVAAMTAVTTKDKAWSDCLDIVDDGGVWPVAVVLGAVVPDAFGRLPRTRRLRCLSDDFLYLLTQVRNATQTSL
jgi:hypothetical protein